MAEQRGAGVMALIAVATLRARIAAALEALTTPAPWRESRWAFDLFPLDPGQYAHLAFAVGAVSTSPTAPMELVRHKRGAEGGQVSTELRVVWAYRIRADRQVADYDSALAAEAVALVAICGTSQTDVHFLPAELSRRMAGDGTWLLGTIRINAIHRIAIQ